MKKSEMYLKAQIAVMYSDSMSDQSKIEILRELMEQEDLALYRERKEKENENG